METGEAEVLMHRDDDEEDIDPEFGRARVLRTLILLSPFLQLEPAVHICRLFGLLP